MTGRRPHIGIFAGAAVFLAALVVWAIINPRQAAAGWLIGFVFWAQILVGSLSLFMIHRLTSGRWGEIIAPVSAPAVAALPVLIILAVPLFAAVPSLYQWAQHPGSLKPDVLSLYLNRPAFILRTLAALVGWSVLAFVLPRSSGWRGQLWSAIGLVFHAVVISSVSIDWYLSIEAPFTSSSFGASVAISSLMAALAWAALRMPVSDDDPAIGDVGGLLLATVLGLTYIDFMAVLVIWYGDLPREASWFVARDVFPWNAMAIAAFALGSLIPTLALIQSRFRNRRWPLRWVALVTLAGLAAYDAYLIAPPFGAAALATGLLGAIGIGLIVVGFTLVLAERPSLITRQRLDVP